MGTRQALRHPVDVTGLDHRQGRQHATPTVVLRSRRTPRQHGYDEDHQCREQDCSPTHAVTPRRADSRTPPEQAHAGIAQEPRAAYASCQYPRGSRGKPCIPPPATSSRVHAPGPRRRARLLPAAVDLRARTRMGVDRRMVANPQPRHRGRSCPAAYPPVGIRAGLQQVRLCSHWNPAPIRSGRGACGSRRPAG